MAGTAREGKGTHTAQPAPARPSPAPAAPGKAPRGAVTGAPRVTLTPPAPVGTKLAPDELDLSTGDLAVPEGTSATMKDGQDADFKVRLPGLAEGVLKLRKRGEHFFTPSTQGILLRHPALGRFGDSFPTVLVLTAKESKVSGWVGIGTPGPVRGGKSTFFDSVAKGAELLNWAGLSKLTFPSTKNQFEDGALDVSVENLGFTVGGFLSGSASMGLDNKGLSFDGSAKVEVPGGSSGELRIKRDNTGALSGRLDIAVSLGSLSGSVVATMSQGFVSIMGQVGYNGDRLSGKVTLVATDERTAQDVTLAKPTAGGDVPIELPGPDKPVKPGKRAFCGWGQLTFRVTDWLAGAATVIINSKGQATIIGEIAPPKEFILFPQKDWRKNIFTLEIKAGYGIPVIGQLFVFASIGLDAVAKVGPGKLYAMKLAGAYSTDPRVPKQLSIEGTLNISAFAGLELVAKAGVGITILGHDLKAGVKLTAMAGVRGYVEATPRIGMREPVGGKREYYIQGHLEIAAQPVLGFSGDLFVSIDTPWWSPLSDKTWTWPLFSLEYPLPGEFGIGADVDYVLGSKQWPSIQFGEVSFDSTKFMTDLLNDNTDEGSGAQEKKQGDWAEGLGAKGKGGAKNKPGSAKDTGSQEGDDIGPIGQEMGFSDGREAHKLWIEENGAQTTIMLASDGKKIDGTLGQWEHENKIALPTDAASAATLLAQARKQAQELDKLADDLGHRKQAAKNAKEYYKKYGKGKKGDKNKSKKDLKKAKKAVREAQKALEKTLEQLAKIVVEMPFQPIAGIAAMLGGAEKIAIATDGKKAVLHVGGRPYLQISKAILTGAVSKAINKAAETCVTKAEEALDKFSAEIGKVLVEKGKVNVRAYATLPKKIGTPAKLISDIGQRLRIRDLLRARFALPLQPATTVPFTARPKTPGKGKNKQLYRDQFLVELGRQLRDQQLGLNKITVDRWFANLALFKMNPEVYRELDASARKTVLEELQQRAQAARDRTQIFLTDTMDAVDQKLEEGNFQGFNKIITRLRRGQQRMAAVRAAVRELERAQDRDEMPDPNLLRPVYANEGVRRDKYGKVLPPEKMDVRIAGRQGAEKAVRRKYLKDLQALIDATDEWSQLAGIAEDVAILHRPDQVAGGYDRFDSLPEIPKQKSGPKWKEYLTKLRKLFGPADVNSNIGREWSDRIAVVVASVRKQVVTHEAQPINKLNLRLQIAGGA